MKSTRRILIALAAAMLLAVAAFAAPSAIDVADNAYETQVYPEAEIMDDGTQASPYVISSAEEFNSYALLVSTNNSDYGSKYYKLSGNIDFDGVTMIPFGTYSSPFSGTFDGDGYALLNVSVADTMYSGVVGYMNGGSILNLSVEYKDMTTETSYSSLKYFGGILGYAQVKSGKTVTVSGCETKGDLKINNALAVYFGGMTGYIKAESGSANFTDCVSYISFDITSQSSGYLGGMVGYAKGGSSHNFIYTNCVSYGDVSLASSYLEATVGGFAGYANKDEAGWSGWASEEDYAELSATVYHFKNCVALGNVYSKANDEANAGGFVATIDGNGDVNFSNCYSPSAQTIEVSAKKTVAEDTGTKTDAVNLENASFYTSTLGFDFTYKWYMSSSNLHLRTVAKAQGAATTLEKAGLRLSSYRSGLRFTAEIENFKRDYCHEYGFIVASAELLGDEELTFDFYPSDSGVAFDGDDIDIFMDKNDEKITFTAVVYNVNPALYSKEIVARTYVSYECNGETVTVYGNPVKASISATAESVKSNDEIYEILDDSQKQLLETMLGK